jgi:hypothetical protein
MTLQISKKGLVEALLRDFEVEIKKYAAAKKFWLNWQAFVEAERNFPVQKPDRSHFENDADFDAATRSFDEAHARRHIPFPEPVAKHALIAACVGPDGNPDFEFSNDMEEIAP